MNEQRVSLPLHLLNAIAAYLAERPFKEVAGLLRSIEEQGKALDPPGEEVKT
jgi:hypothetical protein